MSLIGLMCKRGDTFSLQVLIGRGLFLLLLLTSSPSALRFISSFKEVGVYCAEVTPVPIPNTEVKLCREDNTWLATAWENILMPAHIFLLSSVGRASVRDYTSHREDKRANIND